MSSKLQKNFFKNRCHSFLRKGIQPPSSRSFHRQSMPVLPGALGNLMPLSENRFVRFLTFRYIFCLMKIAL